MADLNNTIVRGKLRVSEDVSANGNITGSGITLSSVKNAGILGTDSSGKVYNNSSAYQPKGNYVTTDKAGTISATKTFSSTPVLSTLKNKKVLGTDANGIIEAHTLEISDIDNLQSQLNGKQPSGAYAERQSAQTITGNWTFTGTTNFNGTTKVNGNEIASKGYVDGIFDSKLNASEATNFAKFTKFDSDTLKMTGARLYRTSAGDAVDRSSMYGYSSQNTYGTTYTRFAGMATIGSSQAFIGYYQYTNHADGSGGEYIGNITLSNGRLARINGSLDSVNELTDAYAVLSDLNNKANKTHTHAISDITNLQSILNGKVNSDDLLKITGSSGFGDSNWHYRKIGHFIFNSSDSRNGAPVHISGVIGSWAQEKMIFDIFVSTRGGLKVNGFVRGTNPSCRLVIDNTENPNIFLAVKGFATYNITVDTFENAQNENNAVRGSFHIDWTGGDDFTGSDVGVTATNFGYQDLLSMVAHQRAYYAYTGSFSETSGTMTKLCQIDGEETGKIICVHGKATSSNSELSIQRTTSHYYDYDCIAVAPTGYNSGTYISCTGVVPPRLQYSINTDSSLSSTYSIFGKNVSEVYVITFDLP